mmetsp:Transcript_22403/g.56010  ORF Transcript_22403/g.56010 Transcript_22403/m.56010 type:complete len:89 (+) Transcript_22403:71-337(+)|eukprot:CAMPEP_0173432886 /NCGR_PEP_ID=MMETSP1357-20121228/10537_1 /TAXON_ID=77926 /ORGANISM="Hemiselmis rufescens, Strain PCC563" /LENGTH=88 /DNA_ID=CAMNT_0014397551 /DNA_START=117 /DNA_END=383 /DNA_ORIENTATION=+
MLLQQLQLVGGGVGTETYDNIYGSEDRMGGQLAYMSLGGTCPITADCVGVPNPGANGSVGTGGSGLEDRMYGFHKDQYWKTNTRWLPN